VYLASAVSGKGLSSFPGLSMVFYNHALEPSGKRLPRYLDLAYCASQDGIPFTHSSNLIAALERALSRTNWPDKFDRMRDLCRRTRARLREAGFTVLADENRAAPSVITIALPEHLRSTQIGWQLEKAGYLLSYRSSYLIRRNWLQICLMGEVCPEHLQELLGMLGRWNPTACPSSAG